MGNVSRIQKSKDLVHIAYCESDKGKPVTRIGGTACKVTNLASLGRNNDPIRPVTSVEQPERTQAFLILDARASMRIR
jgi:hypothetical protein